MLTLSEFSLGNRAFSSTILRSLALGKIHKALLVGQLCYKKPFLLDFPKFPVDWEFCMWNTYRKRLQLPVPKSLVLKVVLLTLRLLSKDWKTKNSSEIVAQGLKGKFNRRQERGKEGRKEEKINQKLL